MKKLLFLLLASVALCSCEEDFSVWKEANTQWLTDNKTKYETEDKTLTVTSSGLQYEVFHTGFGAIPKLGSVVKVNYTGWLIDGTKFDSGTNVILSVENVISGWQEALGKMRQGSHWKIFVPYTIGYGTDGTETVSNVYKIPPYSTLIFDIELVDVQNY